MIRTPTIDVLNPIDWTDADNAGLQLALLGLPIYAGGRRWADATGRTSGGVLTARSATLPAWSVLAGRAAVRLDGSNHVVGSRADLSGPFAIKITLSGATTADFGVPLGTSASDWYFQRTGSACSFTASIGGSFRSVTIPSVFDGQPKRLAVIYTGQVLQGFRNGILVVSTSATGLLTGPKSTVNIGVLGASGNPMTGVTTYSDVQISSYLFDAGHATRDYVWSLDPSRDPRLRRLTGVATFAPIGQVNVNLTLAAITSGTPTTGTPTLTQDHALAAASPGVGTPTAGETTLTQSHTLTPASLSAGAPTVGTATLGQTHALTTLSLASGSPTVGTPTLAQAHVLAPSPITAGSPTTATTALTQDHAFTATGISTGTPTTGTPTLTQNVFFAGVSVLSGTPTVSSLTLTVIVRPVFVDPCPLSVLMVNRLPLRVDLSRREKLYLTMRTRDNLIITMHRCGGR
jgi:hypothetical protein